MQSYCIVHDGPVPIPHCEDGWFITKSGKIITPTEGVSFADVPLKLAGVTPTQDLLVALAFKPTYVRSDLIRHLRVERVDPNDGSPENLVWIFPPEGLETPTHKNLFYIPGFTRYGIAKVYPYKVVNLRTGNFIGRVSGSDGYPNISLTRDDRLNEIRSVRFHRIIATVFNHPGAIIDSLTVNHLNKKRDDFFLGNLEWVTTSENILHGLMVKALGGAGTGLTFEQAKVAYENLDVPGLVKIRAANKNKPMEIKDLRTNAVVFLGSMKEGARFVGRSIGNVCVFLSSSFPKKSMAKWFVCRLVGDDWPDTELADVLTGKSSYAKELQAENVETGFRQLFASAADFIRHSGLTRKQVFGRLDRGSKTPCNGWLFNYVN